MKIIKVLIIIFLLINSIYADTNKSPKIVFTGFKIYSKGSPMKKEFKETEEIVLNFQEGYRVNIEYDIRGIEQPEKVSFYYMMEGLDTDWIDSNNVRFATFTNLLPGEYVFRIRALFEDKDSVIDNAIKIVVSPPWWKKWWAYLLYNVLILLIFLIPLILIIYLIVRVHHLKKEIKLKNRLLEKKNLIS